MRVRHSGHIKGMRNIRGARSVMSPVLCHGGRAGRLRESAGIAADTARLYAGRQFLTASRRAEDGCRHG